MIVFQLPHVPAVNRAALERRIDISWRAMTDRRRPPRSTGKPLTGDARPLLPLPSSSVLPRPGLPASRPIPGNKINNVMTVV